MANEEYIRYLQNIVNDIQNSINQAEEDYKKWHSKYVEAKDDDVLTMSQKLKATPELGWEVVSRILIKFRLNADKIRILSPNSAEILHEKIGELEKYWKQENDMLKKSGGVVTPENAQEMQNVTNKIQILKGEIVTGIKIAEKAMFDTIKMVTKKAKENN